MGQGEPKEPLDHVYQISSRGNGRAAMSREYELAVSTRATDCSCPCSVAHNGSCAVRVVCEGTIAAGRQYGVLLLDGKIMAMRCRPCAVAAGWIGRGEPA